MTDSGKLLIPKDVTATIARWAEEAYPNEGCGLLIGRFDSPTQKRVERLAPLTNSLLTKSVSHAPTLPADRQGTGAGKTEFLMDPAEFNRETLRAEKDGLDVVGVIHTHPDHPPRPSQVDASQPFLAQWSNVIVAVEKGRFREMKAWFRETDDAPFYEEKIETPNGG